jgi:hypothetical protein
VNRQFSTSLAACALLLTSTVVLRAADGVLLVQRITRGGAAETTSQTQIEKNRMRSEITDASGRKVVIFDATKGVLDVIDPDKKTYMEITQAEVDQMAAQMQGAMSQMQQAMANMPPEQRAQMEAMMGRGRAMMMPAAPAKTEYHQAGTDHVGKWTCDKYDVMQAGQKTGEICTVAPSALGFTAADFEVTRQMADFFKKVIPQAAQQMFTVGRQEEQGFAGVPVRTVSGQVTSEITEASRQTFPDTVFAVPAGFQKQSMMGRGRGGE